MAEQMSVDDVVRHVEATEGWFLREDHAIRRNLVGGGCACPISSIDGLGASDWDIAERNRRIDYEDACDVVDAADAEIESISRPHLVVLRRRLLEAAKLTEVEDA